MSTEVKIWFHRNHAFAGRSSETRITISILAESPHSISPYFLKACKNPTRWSRSKIDRNFKRIEVSIQKLTSELAIKNPVANQDTKIERLNLLTLPEF